MSFRCLFFVTQNYSFSILRPVQQEILARGGEVHWYVDTRKASVSLLHEGEARCKSIRDCVALNPEAVLVPGNIVCDWIPGIKVEVFHGLEWKKKGFFNVRGFFDLYCTPGPLVTKAFASQAEKLGYFTVKETGWPKLDPLFKPSQSQPISQRTRVLYAPTFSPSLSSASTFLEAVKPILDDGRFELSVRFHPKMDKQLVAQYHTISHKYFHIDETPDIYEALHAADVMISDTSSIITEFHLLKKPVITIKNAAPDHSLIDIENATEIIPALEQAVQRTSLLMHAIDEAVAQIHPYNDGLSAQRVVNAVSEYLNNPPSRKTKPRNLWRRFKVWMRYWGL